MAANEREATVIYTVKIQKGMYDTSYERVTVRAADMTSAGDAAISKLRKRGETDYLAVCWARPKKTKKAGS